MVSLIVPCYNGEAFVDRCIDSILAQTYSDIELIFIDDGSTDRSAQRVEARREELENSLTQFVFLKQENHGLAATCSRGFSYATGIYLALLDVDDLLLPESIRLRVEYLEKHPDCALVRTNGYYVPEGDLDQILGEFDTDAAAKQKTDLFEDIMLGRTTLWAGSYMVRMDVLEQIYPDRAIYTDCSAQNLQFGAMACYGRIAGYVDVPLMKYVQRKESDSHFSGPNALAKELRAYDGYANIRRYLIDHYVDERERPGWHIRFDKMYTAIRMQLAAKYGDKQLMKESYAKLRSLGGGGDLNTRILYHSLLHPPVAFVLRAVRKVHRLCTGRGFPASGHKLHY